MIKKWIIVFGLLMMVMSVGCMSDQGVQNRELTIEESQVVIYLLNGSSDALVEVEVTVDGSSQETQIDGVIDSLIKGDNGRGYKSTIPMEDMIEDVEILDSGVRIYVDAAFSDMSDVSYLVCRSSIIKSLTAIEGITYVEFYEDNLPMKDDWGKVYGAFYPDDIVTVSNTANSVVQLKSVILYYPDEQGNYLIKVDRDIELLNGENLEERLIEELMISHGDYGSPVPEGTIVKNTHVTNGICYIDFNEAFRTNHYGGSTGELMTVYSIVNTLTELPNISRVQFLIEGEKVDSYKGHLDFSDLFEFNIELIAQATSKK